MCTGYAAVLAAGDDLKLGYSAARNVSTVCCAARGGQLVSSGLTLFKTDDTSLATTCFTSCTAAKQAQLTIASRFLV